MEGAGTVFKPTRPGGGDDDNDDFVYKEEVLPVLVAVRTSTPSTIWAFHGHGHRRSDEVVVAPSVALGYRIPDGWRGRTLVCCSAGPARHQWRTCRRLSPPPGLTKEQLAAMMASGCATVQYDVTFEEQRLGMCLSDARSGVGVEVLAFTSREGVPPGPAQTCGKIQTGDRITSQRNLRPAKLPRRSGFDCEQALAR